MTASGILFVASIPAIALSHGYGFLVFGRLLQGISAGLIGVVVPLYLAECLGAANRGRGTGIFQWLLTLGIVVAAFIGMYFSFRVAEVAKLGDAARLPWRSRTPPGGASSGFRFRRESCLSSEASWWPESPSVAAPKGRVEAARTALLRSRSADAAELELREMNEMAPQPRRRSARTRVEAPGSPSSAGDMWTCPFALACVILACNQATGVNSNIGNNTNILLQAGLSDVQAHWGYVILTLVNFLLTIVGVVLVDRRGRKFLLSLGSA